MIKILAIPGSLRKASLNRQLVRACQKMAPDDVEISIFYLDDIPLFNQDIEDSVGYPPAVTAMRNAIAESDGVIFATPEYNGAETGVMKNGVDWASRKKLLGDMPATVISGSPGALGATKAQESLRSVLNHMGMAVLARPSLAIPKMDKKLANDQIIDEMTAKFVSDWLVKFRDWIVQLQK